MDSQPAIACGAGGPGGTSTDTFSRSVINGWGTADTGGAWLTSGGFSSDYAVNGSVGTMLLPAANLARMTYLPSSWLDSDSLVRVKFDRKPATQRVNAYVVGRYDSVTGGFYAIRTSLVYDGTMKLTATKKPGTGAEASVGTEANLGATGAADT